MRLKPLLPVFPIAALVVAASVLAQQPGLYVPVPETGAAEAAPALEGSLRLCALDALTMAYDLRLGPGTAPPQTRMEGCVGFGLLTSSAAGLTQADGAFHLVVQPAGADTVLVGTADFSGDLCTRPGLADGTWRRIGDCAVWRPLEIEQTQVMLRDLGLIGVPDMGRRDDDAARGAFDALLARLAPDHAGAPPQAIATLIRLDWRERCRGDGTC